MLFVKLSPKQAAAYSYTCSKLQDTLNKMSNARKTLEASAEASFDKSFAKCVYLFTSESQQFENEIHAQIDSFNCRELYVHTEITRQKTHTSFSTKDIELLCGYLEENYVKSYKQLLNDKNLHSSLKSLIKNHLQAFLFSLTQLRLFQAVKSSVN